MTSLGRCVVNDILFSSEEREGRGVSTNVIAAHLLNDKMLGNGYAHSEIEKTNTTN